MSTSLETPYVCVCVCVCVCICLCVNVALSFSLCVSESNKFVRNTCVSVLSISAYIGAMLCLSVCCVCLRGCKFGVSLIFPSRVFGCLIVKFLFAWICETVFVFPFAYVSSLLHWPLRRQSMKKKIAGRLKPVPQLIRNDLGGGWHHTTGRHVFMNNIQEDVQSGLAVGPRFTTGKPFNWRGLFCLPLKAEVRTWRKLIPHFIIHRAKLMNCRHIYMTAES